MAQTISKHIGEGFASGELYAALAYDSTDKFGGMQIKGIKISPAAGNVGLALGDSSNALSYTAGSPPLSFYFTAAGSGTTNLEPFYLKSTVTGTSPVGGRARFHTYCNVTAGGWLNALKSYMQFGSSGKITGLASSLCVEMDLPDANLGAGGTYAPLEIELNPGASTVSGEGLIGNHVSLMYISINTNQDDFDDHGYLFHLTGVNAGSGHLFQTGNKAPATVGGTLRIGIGTTAYYLILYTSEATT